jgi:hypothetical protein
MLGRKNMIDFGWRSKLPIKLGKIVASPAALDALKRAGVNLPSLLVRHAGGDWSELSPEDAQANQDAVLYGERVIGAFTLPTGAT